MSHAASTARPKDLMGAWNAEVTFVGGPRIRETESVVLTLLPDGTIVHRDELPLDDGQLPRGIGEWTADNGRLSYRFKLSWPPRAAVRRPWST